MSRWHYRPLRLFPDDRTKLEAAWRRVEDIVGAILVLCGPFAALYFIPRMLLATPLVTP